MRARFDIIEHTADAGIVARADTLAGAFEQAALGMYALLVDLASVEQTAVRRVEARGEDIESLLIAWLSELLFVTETEHLLFSRFEVQVGEAGLTGQAHGETIDEAKHEIAGAIKGVTRHGLEAARVDGGYRFQIIFDM